MLKINASIEGVLPILCTAQIMSVLILMNSCVILASGKVF